MIVGQSSELLNLQTCERMTWLALSTSPTTPAFSYLDTVGSVVVLLQSLLLQSCHEGGWGYEANDGNHKNAEPVLTVGDAEIACHDAGNETLG